MDYILVIEDDEVWIENFKKAAKGLNLIYATNVEAATTILERENINLIILDLSLPDDPSAESILEAITEHSDKIPIIVSMPIKDEKIVKMAANYGVQDFLVKDDYKDNLSVAVYEIIAKTEIKNNLYRTIHNLENINKGLDILNENNKVFLSHG